MTVMIGFLVFYDGQAPNDPDGQTQKDLESRHYLCEDVTVKQDGQVEINGYVQC